MNTTATDGAKLHMLQWQPVTGARPKKAKKARAPPPEDRAFGCRAGSAGTLERFIQMSVPTSEHGVDELKTIASQLGLKMVRGGRDDKYDRWGFGLTGPVSKFLANAGIKVPASLFKWKRSKTKAEMYGTLLPVNNIRENVKMWMDAREQYARLLSDTERGSGVESGANGAVTPTPVDPHMQSKDRTWTESAMQVLIEDRFKPAPETYTTIAATLNRLRAAGPDGAYGSVQPFSLTDVANKWHRTFVSKDDATNTVKFLRDLEVFWPGTKVKVHCAGQ